MGIDFQIRPPAARKPVVLIQTQLGSMVPNDDGSSQDDSRLVACVVAVQMDDSCAPPMIGARVHLFQSDGRLTAWLQDPMSRRFGSLADEQSTEIIEACLRAASGLVGVVVGQPSSSGTVPIRIAAHE